MEAAGILLATEQVISTTIEGGALAGYAISRPTLPLKARLQCIGTADGTSPDSLARSDHTISIVNGDVYIFGGFVEGEKLAGNEMHILKLSNLEGGTLGPQYQAIPAVALEGDEIPASRAGHTACVIDGKILIFGGTETGSTKHDPIIERGRVWIFDPRTLHWSHQDVANEKFPTKCYHGAAVHDRRIIVHGGYSRSEGGAPPDLDTWAFDVDSRTWTELPGLPNNAEDEAAAIIVTAPPTITVVDERLYHVASSRDHGSQVNILYLGAAPQYPEWMTIRFPTNPATTGPRPRIGAGMVPVDTGMGRTYILYLLGERDEPAATQSVGPKEADGRREFWSDIWALQLPAVKQTAAQLKDEIRDKVGMQSHEAEWAEVVLDIGEPDVSKTSGKSHPGPRGHFGFAALDGKRMVLWGGVDPDGHKIGDGWVVEVGI